MKSKLILQQTSHADSNAQQFRSFIYAISCVYHFHRKERTHAEHPPGHPSVVHEYANFSLELLYICPSAAGLLQQANTLCDICRQQHHNTTWIPGYDVWNTHTNDRVNSSWLQRSQLCQQCRYEPLSSFIPVSTLQRTPQQCKCKGTCRRSIW